MCKIRNIRVGSSPLPMWERCFAMTEKNQRFQGGDPYGRGQCEISTRAAVVEKVNMCHRVLTHYVLPVNGHFAPIVFSNGSRSGCSILSG